MNKLFVEEKEKRLFEDSPVIRAIMSLALPSIAGQIILVIYNMADTYFVGLTDSDSMITAVTVCMPAFMFLSAISNLFGVGGAGVISRFLGVDKVEEARSASSFSVWGCLCVSSLYCTCAYVFRDHFVNLLGGAAPEVHGLAVDYLTVGVVIGGVFTAMNTLLSHLIRAEGKSFQASLGIIIGGVLNIVLDPLFMFVILPRGNEVLGAALATMLSNTAALLYFVVFIFVSRKKMNMSVRPCRRMFEKGISLSVFSTGVPACLMTLCENISYAFLDNLMMPYGTAAQAGIGVAKKVNMLTHCTVRGMSQGVLPLIGYNYASGNRTRMKKVFLISSMISVLFSIVCMLSFIVFSYDLVSLFVKGATSSHEFGSKCLKILCLGAPFSAWAYAVISFLQATGNNLKSLILALLRKGVLDIPLMFAFDSIVPAFGIVIATPAADLVCCVCAVVFFVIFIRKHGTDTPCCPERQIPGNTKIRE